MCVDTDEGDKELVPLFQRLRIPIQFTTSQHRLEQVSCIRRALGSSCTDDRMHFIDKQQDPTL